MRLITQLCLIILMTSCAAWRLNDSEKIKDFPADMVVSEKIPIVLNFNEYKVFYNGELKLDAINEQKKLEVRKLVEQAYKESGLFKITSKEKAKFIVDINLTQKGQGSTKQALLTWVTLYLYPSKATDLFEVKTTFKDMSADIQAEFVKSDTVVMWQQLFLIFAMPFKYPYSELKNVIVDLNRATILEAFHEPFLKSEI